MASKVEQAYREAVSNLAATERYLEMVGKEYRGGGGGVGEVRSACAQFTVYYQERDGSTNYHDSPAVFDNAMGLVIKRHFSDLAAEALEVVRATKRSRAEEFHREMEAVAKDIEP